MNTHEFNQARRAIERERFAASQQTTFDIAIERTRFEEKRAQRIIQLTDKAPHKKAGPIREVQERKVLREQQNRLRLQELKKCSELSAAQSAFSSRAICRA